MIWEVRISYKKGVQDSEGDSTLSGLWALGFEDVKQVGTAKVFLIKGDISYDDVEMMCQRLLSNPVSQDYTIKEVN